MSPKLKGCLRSKTEKQQALVNHLVDLDRKINSTKFQMDQLQVGKQAFMGLLKEELSKPKNGIEDGQLVEQPNAASTAQ